MTTPRPHPPTRPSPTKPMVPTGKGFSLHALIHGHHPEWERYGYDFLTWKVRCSRCLDTP